MARTRPSRRSAPPTPGNPSPELEANTIHTSPLLDEFQTAEGAHVLNTISKVRKCGLESVLSLPQIVVCGDQSSGKSSVLEALTQIPFPRNDNLCTRFATEISLRREPLASLTVRIIPDTARPDTEQVPIKQFSKTITNFSELPKVMEDASGTMGILDARQAFAKDTLSIEITGPNQPQLTLVDIPGIIQASTRGVSVAEVAMVGEITDRYIKQPRTICLAVISATNDAANQPILQRVRQFDPQGDRTLGVITKPDKLSAGSGSEAKFIELARNEDVFFKLGWHVIKNRAFEERVFSIQERNLSEKRFFNTSNFSILPLEDIGIDTLRAKLCRLLFDHIKRELPQLQSDLELTLQAAREELKTLGDSRSTSTECREYLTRLTMACCELVKAGVSGNYAQSWFQVDTENNFLDGYSIPKKRIRAFVQFLNKEFTNDFRDKGHKYKINFSKKKPSTPTAPEPRPRPKQAHELLDKQKKMTKSDALIWVRDMLHSCRGTELVGNFSSNLVASLFWEQSERWEKLALIHIDQVHDLCRGFLRILFDTMVPSDISVQLWSCMVSPKLKERMQAAKNELDRLIIDSKDFPMNYNSAYTDIIYKKRQDRFKNQLTPHLDPFPQGMTASQNVANALMQAVARWGESAATDMEEFSCEEALDCLLAIYEVQRTTFVSNVVTQVIERHIVRGLWDIFSPTVLTHMSEAKMLHLASEPSSSKRRREFLNDRIEKLEEGEEIFRLVAGT